MKTPRTRKLPSYSTQALGAFPRPKVVLDLLTRRHEFTPERFNQIMDDLVRFAIRTQGLAGLDVVSDGQWRHTHHVEFLRRVGGFESVRKTGRGMGDVVVKHMSPTGSVYKADADFLVNNTARLTKIAIPSPFFMAITYWHPEFSRSAYPTRQHFMDHLVEILFAEVHALASAGIDMIQLEDPALTRFCNSRLADDERIEWEVETQFPRVVAGFNRIAESAVGKAEIQLRCPRGAGAVGGEYKNLLPRLKDAKIDRINLEFARGGTVEELALLPDHIDVGMGVIEVGAGTRQTVETMQELALAGTKMVVPSRIALNPNCGIAADGADSPSMDEAYENLRLLTAAAKGLRGKS